MEPTIKTKEEIAKEIWDTLSKIDVSKFIEKKQSLSYLSWARAWMFLKTNFPDADYSVREWDNKPYFYDENLGYLVETSVSIKGIVHTMRLPVLDSNNLTLKSTTYLKVYKKGTDREYSKEIDAATMFDINTSIMRCLVKNIAMFGLGCSLYAGEDLPIIIESSEEINDFNKFTLEVSKSKSVDELNKIGETYNYMQRVDSGKWRMVLNNKAKSFKSNNNE
jgi:hypothetical protein